MSQSTTTSIRPISQWRLSSSTAFSIRISRTGLNAADVAFEREWNEPIALERWQEVIARAYKSEQV